MSRTRKFFIKPFRDDKWKVQVWMVPSTKVMYREYGEGAKAKLPMAFFQGYRTYEFKKGGKKGKETGEYGRIVLNGSDLDVDTIAHECGHAAHTYCRRTSETNFKKRVTEEIYCYALGHMVDQVMSWALKNGYKFKVPKWRRKKQ